MLMGCGTVRDMGRDVGAALVSVTLGTWFTFRSRITQVRLLLLLMERPQKRYLAALQRTYLLEYEEQDYKQLDDIILGAVSKQFVLKLKVQAKPYSDARRMKCVVLKAKKVNPSAESCRLREAIDAHFGDCLGSCLEFGSSMPTYSSLSDLKGCSAAQSSNSSHTISPGRARQLCSADGYRQQVNEFYMEPSTLSAFGACGWGHDHRSDIDGQRSSAPDGFMGRFHGASPGVNIALDMRPMVLSHRQSANLCAGD